MGKRTIRQRALRAYKENKQSFKSPLFIVGYYLTMETNINDAITKQIKELNLQEETLLLLELLQHGYRYEQSE